jgi:hypothetical protein
MTGSPVSDLHDQARKDADSGESDSKRHRGAEMSDARKLAELLLVVANNYEASAATFSAGAVRLGAHRLQELAQSNAVLRRQLDDLKPAGGCLWCGEPLPERRKGAGGKRRKYCKDACRKAAFRARKNATVTNGRVSAWRT